VTKYPGDGQGFTMAEYENTRGELAAEISMFNRVKNWVG
jgi:hypothetical protein